MRNSTAKPYVLLERGHPHIAWNVQGTAELPGFLGAAESIFGSTCEETPSYVILTPRSHARSRWDWLGSW